MTIVCLRYNEKFPYNYCDLSQLYVTTRLTHAVGCLLLVKLLLCQLCDLMTFSYLIFSECSILKKLVACIFGLMIAVKSPV